MALAFLQLKTSHIVLQSILLLCLLLLFVPSQAQNASSSQTEINQENIQGIETVTDAVREQIQEQQQEETEVAIVEEDAQLTTRISTVLKNVDDFSEVQVAVTAGVVKLTGTVSKQESKQAAAELARSFDGVLYVDNDIIRTADVEDNVLPIIQKARSYASETVARLPIIAIALLVLFAFWLLSRFIARWDGPFNRMGANKLIQSLVQQLFSTLVFIIGLLLAIDIVEATPLVGAVLGTAGIAGIAIGFAFRNIVENYLAGILLSLRQPFAMNDFIKIDTFEGKVVRLTPREVLLMTYQGDHVRIPNSKVFNSVVYNYTKNPKRRFDFNINIDAKSDILKAQHVATETIATMTGVLADPSVGSLIKDHIENFMVINFHGWIDQREVSYSKVRSEAIRLVKLALDEADLRHEHVAESLLENTSRSEHSKHSEHGEHGEHGIQNTEVIHKHTEEEKTVQDVSVDTTIDEQIIEELDSSDEENLLEEVRIVAAND